MSTNVENERVDARILSAKLLHGDVDDALIQWVLRRAQVPDYEAEHVDLAKSTVSVQYAIATGVVSAEVVVRVDLSRLPQAMPAPDPLRLDRDRVASAVRRWSSSDGRMPITQLVDEIQEAVL